MIDNISIVGGGSWGMALAKAFSHRCNITIYNRTKSLCKISNYIFTNEFSEIVKNNVIFITVPAQSIRTILESIRKLSLDNYIIICAKGIEINSTKFMSEVAEEFISKDKLAILSGPNFAEEIINDLPASTVIASENFKFAQEISRFLSTKNFKLYPSDDPISAEIGGSLKNIIAIACGIAAGIGMGENYKALLICAGLAEMKILCQMRKGRLSNIMSMSGIGDLTLTCTSQKSRNLRFGIDLVQKKNIDKTSTIEGVNSCISVKKLIDIYKIDLPICKFVYDFIYNDFPASEIKNLFEKLKFIDEL